MANLPQYTRVPNNVEMSPLWKKDSATIDIEAQLPPVGQRVEVKFTFVPRWPMKGSRQNVISILGATKQVRLVIYLKTWLDCIADLGRLPPTSSRRLFLSSRIFTRTEFNFSHLLVQKLQRIIGQ